MNIDSRLATALLLTAAASAQATRVTVRTGEEFSFRVRQAVTARDRLARSTELAFDFTLTVRDVRKDGSIEATVRWTRIFGRGGILLEGREFDTASKEQPAVSTVRGEFLAALRNFLTVDQTVIYDHLGQLIDAPSLEENARRAATKPTSLARILIPATLDPRVLRDRLRVFLTVPDINGQAAQSWTAKTEMVEDFAPVTELAYTLDKSSSEEFQVSAIATPSRVPVKDTSTPSSQVQGVKATWTATSSGVMVQSRIEGSIRRSMPTADASTSESTVVHSAERMDRPAQAGK